MVKTRGKPAKETAKKTRENKPKHADIEIG